MPSLNSLGEFMSSFADIANERNAVISKKQNYYKLPLPDKEPEPMEFIRRAAPVDDFSEEALPEEPGDGFDFNAFLENIPSEIFPQALDEPPSIDELLGDINQPSSDVDDLLQDTAPPSASSFDDNISGDDFLSASAAEEFPSDEFSAEGLPQDTESFSMDGFSAPDEQEAPDFGTGDFDLPELGSTDFGDGFLDKPEAATEGSDSVDFGVESSNIPEEAQEDFDSIDLGGESPEMNFPAEEQPKSQDSDELQDFDLPETETPADDGDFNLDGITGTDEGLGGIPSADYTPDFGSDNLEDAIDMGGESVESSAEAADDGLSSSDLGADLGSGFDSPLPDTDFSGADLSSGFDSPLPDTDFSGADFDSSLPDFDSGGETELPAEGADYDAGSIDLGNDFSSESIELDTASEEQRSAGQSPEVMSSGTFGDDDFTIPGLEAIFDKTKSAPTPAPAPKKTLFKRKKTAAKEEFKADEDIEEIRLSEDEVESLLRTLSAYPLNLRVACEELIVEKVLLPQQLLKLIHLLKYGAGVRETAAFAEELLGKPIVIPRGFEKMTGAAFEAEQASFAYIFVHNFLPVLRLFAVIAALAASVFYLGYKFIYIPIKAESIYKRGYERIPAGEYQRANQLFNEAFSTHPKKKWFYLYAEAFRDQRRYLLAEEKYDELLRYYQRDKKGVLDYANLETYYLMNYDKANRLLQQQLIDYAPNDYDGLIAAGDNFLLWGDSDPEKFYDKYEDARFSYARVLDNYGWTPPVIERMMKYFIRTDNLKEVLNCRAWFENNKKAKLSPPTLAELGGYLLDKQLEEVTGVPNAYIESIESVRGLLLEAVNGDPELPEPHYHLARYHHSLGNTYEERLTLENAIRAFDLARTETVRRRLYRVDTHYRYANLLINNKEFFPAEEQVIKGIQLYEDFLSRNLISPSPQLGQLYAVKGDLEYFVKTGNMNAALNDYRLAERYGYSPPEVQYRMGSAYYQLQDWRNALEYLVKASVDLPLNRRLLYALGNASYQRGDYFAAQGYYNRLLDVLDSQRVRMPVLLPNDNAQYLELGERIMMAMNNTGVVYEMLAEQTANRNYRSTALAYYAESARAWDSITRNPETMIRMNLTGSPGTPGINLGYLNASNALRARSDYNPEIFVRIDKDVLEPSRWEELAPTGGLF